MLLPLSPLDFAKLPAAGQGVSRRADMVRRGFSKTQQTTTMKFLTLILTILGSGGFALAADAQKPAYPLTTCVVSGKKLDSMGGPYVMDHKGQEVRLCCEHCKPKFEKDPAAYLKKIQDASK